MKKLKNYQLEEIKGGGCRRHLRRFHRAMKKHDSSAFDHMEAYADCMRIQ